MWHLQRTLKANERLRYRFSCSHFLISMPSFLFSCFAACPAVLQLARIELPSLDQRPCLRSCWSQSHLQTKYQNTSRYTNKDDAYFTMDCSCGGWKHKPNLNSTPARHITYEGGDFSIDNLANYSFSNKAVNSLAICVVIVNVWGCLVFLHWTLQSDQFLPGVYWNGSWVISNHVLCKYVCVECFRSRMWRKQATATPETHWSVFQARSPLQHLVWAWCTLRCTDNMHFCFGATKPQTLACSRIHLLIVCFNQTLLTSAYYLCLIDWVDCHGFLVPCMSFYLVHF